MSFTGVPLSETYTIESPLQVHDYRMRNWGYGVPLTCNFLLPHAPEDPLYMAMHQLQPGCFYMHQLNNVCCKK